MAVCANPFGLPGGTLGLVPFNLGLTVNWLLEMIINIEGNTWSEVKRPPPWAFLHDSSELPTSEHAPAPPT